MRLTLMAIAVASSAVPLQARQAEQPRAVASVEQPSVGDIFDPPATTDDNLFEWRFRGWRYAGRGAALGFGRFVIFTDERSYMIAATEVLAPSREPTRDGIQKITAIKIVTPSPGEQQAVSCDFVTLSPVLAFYAGGIARGFFVIGEEIIEKRWFIDGDCYDSPD